MVVEHGSYFRLLPQKTIIGCWVYTVKVGSDENIDQFKAQLGAKGYTQIFGLDYKDTFSPMAKITYFHLFLVMAGISHWPIHQLDIKKMPYYMENYKKRFTWINPLVLLLLVDLTLFVAFDVPSTTWSSLLVPSLVVLVLHDLNLVWLAVRLIILCFHSILHLAYAFILLYILTTSSYWWWPWRYSSAQMPSA